MRRHLWRTSWQDLPRWLHERLPVTSRGRHFGSPPQTIHNVHGSAESCDAVVIRTGSNIITLLFSRQSQIESELAMFERIGFSKMEKAIALLLLDGLSNKDIANKLFISVATVKTHVNNLYKKLPSALKQRMMSIRK